MTSIQEEKERALQAGMKAAHPEPGDELVISGISGCYPGADDMDDFRDKLFDKVDLVKNDIRPWRLDHPEIPKNTGKINFAERFDGAFFGLHSKQLHTLDPIARRLLELSFSAIIDAGINPKQLKGSRCGVFIGTCYSESEKIWYQEGVHINGFSITGSVRPILANRISYYLGVNGPSMVIDAACSSSLYAVETAYRALRNGECDMALVGGANMCMHPYVTLQFYRLGVLSTDGACKVFDNSANGYCRSEAISVILLQKKKDAKRIYATIVHAKTNCDGYKEQGITYPSGQMQYQLLKDFYLECGVDPSTLNFIEAHGTGTQVGDPEECAAIDKIFCKGRKEPLLIGSVKSNIGHSEPTSGLCSISKVLIAMESGYIPPNLHFVRAREGISAIEEGRLKVVTTKHPWEGGLAGVNSFGFGGANCHVLLQSNPKEKANNGAPNDSIPRLVVVSGRTEEACRHLLQNLESKPIDVELVKLLHEVFADEIFGHVYRAFTILNNSDRKIRDIQYYSGEKREICFFFSGLGTQWPGMGKSLLKIPVFQTAMNKCHAALQPKGIDLMKIITDEDPKTLDNIIHSFVGITAIQIGLVDILRTIGIEPDSIIGHSVGELGCAYADGCFTAEQAVLTAYYRGLACSETEFVKGSMAVIGMGYKNIKKIVPPGVEVACHNGPDSCNVSGPQDAVKKFVTELTNQGVYAKELSCSNIPFHSRYMAKTGSKLLNYLKQVIPYPVLRSKKWISTSVKESDWDGMHAKYSSAEYHTNSLLNQIYLEESSQHIPQNAIVIEVSPHGLFQAILKRTLKKGATNVALMQRGHADNTQVLLTGIGKLYELGVQVHLHNLYPHVPYPVSRGTQSIAPLIKWDYSKEWFVTTFCLTMKIKCSSITSNVTLVDEEKQYLAGHVIDGRNLYPATGYLILVWEAFAIMHTSVVTDIPIVLENVKFLRATTIPKDGLVEFIVQIHSVSGKFEVLEGQTSVVTGRVYQAVNDDDIVELPVAKVEEEGTIPMNTRDIYKELKLRGYHYSGMFRGLVSLDPASGVGRIAWEDNYVAFMDNMLQTQIIEEDTRALYVPTSIDKVVIHSKKHEQMVQEMLDKNEKSLPVYVHRDVQMITAGGIQIRGLNASQISRRKATCDPVLEKYLFVPHIVPAGKNQDMSMLESIRLCIHLALENVQGIKVKVVEIGDETVLPESIFVAPYVASILGDLPLIQAEIVLLASSNNEKAKGLDAGVTVEDKKIAADQSCLVVVGSNVLSRADVLQQALGALKQDGFLIARENPESNPELNEFHVLVDLIVDGERILLLRKKSQVVFKGAPLVVKISEKDEFSWVEPLKEQLKNSELGNVVLVAEKEQTNGIIGLTNCLRKEPGGERIRCVFVMDETAPGFDLQHPLYADQLAKNLAINVYKNGEWGSYRHQALPLSEKVLCEHVYLNTSAKGDLSSFKCYQGRMECNKHEMEGNNSYTVYYSSINFRDVMIASGKLASDVITRGRLDQDVVIGFEFSGRNNRTGKRVMGMITKGAMTSQIGQNATGYLLWDVPDYMTMAEAATIPVVYCTVYTALVMNGHMKKGESVLIHSGTGGVGLAAINICLGYECNIFVTVGTQEKRDFLLKEYPQIPESHIGNSRDTSFEEMIKRETNGRGVDLVLNSLAEEKLQASLRCLAEHGRFLEIGKYDLANNNPIGMEAFGRNISFHGVQLDVIFHAAPEKRQELLDILCNSLADKVVPIRHTVFDISEVEQAFRFMTTGKHMGKVLLKLRDEEPEKITIPKPLKFEAEPRFFASVKKSYVIIGGLGGFGLELTDWLVVRGARNVVLTSRTGLKNGYQSSRIRLWKEYGAKVVISTEDVTTEEGVTNLLNKANSLAPVDAIFNLAVVLRDAIFENQTVDNYKVSFGGKAIATQHLDKVSRKLCPELNYFVVFSSVSCGRGNAGQTNYGMANSVMERVCEARVRDGLPGTAIQWGAIGDVGLVADMQEDHQELVIGGTLQQSISSCLQCLDTLLKQKHPIVASMVVAEKRAGTGGSGNILETVINIMGIRDTKSVSMHSSLAELGMDSMMAVEIKQTLEREFELFLTAQDIRGLTFAKLIELGEKTTESGEGTENLSGSTTDVAEGRQILNNIVRMIGDEITAKIPLVALDSKYGDAKTNLEAVGKGEPFVILIPGIEGMVFALEPLARNLNAPTIGLQYPFGTPDNLEIVEIAKFMYKSLKAISPVNSPCMIVGHSTGTLIALEMAYMMIQDGRLCEITLLDGAPDFLQAICRIAMPSQNENDFETSVLMSVFNAILPAGKNSKVEEELNKLSDWDSKLEKIRSLLPETKYSQEFLKQGALNFRMRLKAVINFKSTRTSNLGISMTLIRPTDQVLPDIFPDDYNLSKMSGKPVKVHFVEGNHTSMLELKMTASLIESDFMQKFANGKPPLMSIEEMTSVKENKKQRAH